VTVGNDDKIPERVMSEGSVSSNRGDIVIYTTSDGSIRTEVRMKSETLWPTQRRMGELFEKDSDTIGLHLKNSYLEGELEESATTEDFSVVQQEGSRNVTRTVKHYNLDAILSVGYRVNSKRGTQFRIWANGILKEHLVRGYTINKKRLQEQRENIQSLHRSIQMVERSLSEQVQSMDEARNVIRILSEFSRGLEILDDYDHESLELKDRTERAAVQIEPEEFLGVVNEMRRDFDSGVFGQPKDRSFESSVRQIYQYFGGKELYPAVIVINLFQEMFLESETHIPSAIVVMSGISRYCKHSAGLFFYASPD
jgi:hypothetical protein